MLSEQKTLSEAITAAAQRAQLDLLAELNQRHMDLRPGGRELAARAQSYELAFNMQAAAPEAVDLGGDANTANIERKRRPAVAVSLRLAL